MGKTKTLILRFIVFLLVFVGVLAIIYLISEIPFFAIHDAGAYVKVWLDTNDDGNRDNDEPFLPNVCVWAGYASSYQLFSSWQEICEEQYFRTNSSGEWSDFFPGGSCNEIYIVANPPNGLRPTTPLIVNDCSAEFGFTQSKSVPETPVLDVRQYLRKSNIKEMIFSWLTKGIVIVLISVLAGIISIKIVRPVKSEKR